MVYGPKTKEVASSTYTRRMNMQEWSTLFGKPNSYGAISRSVDPLDESFDCRKNWEGCEGLSVSSEMKLQLQPSRINDAWLSRLVLFDRTSTFLIYPRPYVAKVKPFHTGGQLAGEFYRAGETIYAGPVILNWNDVQLAVAIATMAAVWSSTNWHTSWI